jgi:hypothetical protein
MNSSFYAYFALLYFEALSFFIIILMHRSTADNDENMVALSKVKLGLHVLLDTVGAWVWTAQILLWTDGKKTGTDVVVYCFFATIYNVTNWIVCMVYEDDLNEQHRRAKITVWASDSDSTSSSSK